MGLWTANHSPLCAWINTGISPAYIPLNWIVPDQKGDCMAILDQNIRKYIFTGLSRFYVANEMLIIWSSSPAERWLIITTIFITHDTFFSWYDNAYTDMHFDEYHTDAFDEWSSLLWRHNGRDSISNHHPHHCLLIFVFRRRSKKISKSASLAVVRGIHRGAVNSPHQSPVTREMLPFDDVIMMI